MFDGQVYVRASRVPGLLASAHAQRRVAQEA
jgi:hypothetical protein